VLAGTLKSIESLAGEIQDLAHDNRPQIDALIAQLNKSSTKLDVVLANSQVVSEQAASMLTQNRSDIERTLANVRDASGTGLKLVQKLYGNPFYLSPFYKPRPEDIKAQEMYDSANSFLLGAKEFHDALKTLQSMQDKAMTKREQEAYNRLFTRAWDLTGQMGVMQRQFAEQIRDNTPVRR
jgi:phospholipid/cholesterol/gamma-HCH transport system substrate-binding protein